MDFNVYLVCFYRNTLELCEEGLIKDFYGMTRVFFWQNHRSLFFYEKKLLMLELSPMLTPGRHL